MEQKELQTYENPWKLDGKEVFEFDADAIGFVYVLTAPDGVKYIGKKILHGTKYKQVKGKRKKIKCDSDWRDYYGSSEAFVKRVNEDKLNCKREILHVCFSKAEMGYLEAKEQFKHDVLLSEDFDNGWIMCRVTKPHLKKYKERLNGIIQPKKTKKSNKVSS